MRDLPQDEGAYTTLALIRQNWTKSQLLRGLFWPKAVASIVPAEDAHRTIQGTLRVIVSCAFVPMSAALFERSRFLRISAKQTRTL
jgi:hypothetical protein